MDVDLTACAERSRVPHAAHLNDDCSSCSHLVAVHSRGTGCPACRVEQVLAECRAELARLRSGARDRVPWWRRLLAQRRCVLCGDWTGPGDTYLCTGDGEDPVHASCKQRHNL